VAGDIVGRIARWSASTNGVLYHHVHMNVVRPDPAWTSVPNPYVDGWLYYNPIDLMFNGNYTSQGSAPFSNGIMYFLPNQGSTAFASSADSGGATVNGQVDIVVNLEDLFTPVNNVPGDPYILGLYEVAYDVRASSGEVVVPRLVLVDNDILPKNWLSSPNLTNQDLDRQLLYVHKQQFTYQGTRYQSLFNYNTRILYYTPTNTFMGEPNDADGFWDTTVLPNGTYDITVFALDYWGNEFNMTRSVSVSN
jgi:hypothetical protein